MKINAGNTNLGIALFLGAQLLVAACNTSPQAHSGESGVATSHATTLPEHSGEIGGTPTTVWPILEVVRIEREAPPLLVMVDRGPHALLAHEVRAIKRCVSLDEVLSSALTPPPESVIEAVGALVDVCQELSKLEVGDLIQAAVIADLSAALSDLG
ncbi:MAG TPA: hypothetical protein PK594_17010, partial [Mycobacterium sp.]|nr:hypothetical protein [Mycobacterium sp.]